MLRFVVRRLLLLVPILVGVSILVFIWIRLLPGSPAQALLGERATPQSIAQLRLQFGLDKPLYVQYWRYLVETVGHLNLGTSIKTFRPVTFELQNRFPATVELALAAMVFAIGFGVPLGFFAAKKYGSFFDHASLVASLLGISIPIFFLGLILKYIFAVRLHWLPSIGREDVLAIRSHPTNFYILDAILAGDAGALWDTIKHLLLPAIALGSIPLAIVARITRAAVLDVQNEDYVRTARAKGLPPHEVDSRHVLRNALLPITTIIGLQTGLLLSGAVLTETVFAWPGVGSLVLDAILRKDYPVVLAAVEFVAAAFIVINVLLDLLYGYLDPRLQVART